MTTIKIEKHVVFFVIRLERREREPYQVGSSHWVVNGRVHRDISHNYLNVSS